MKGNLTPQARDDLVAIRDWIAQDNERAAERVVSRILQAAMMVGQFPKLGRVGEVVGTRDFAVPGLPYRIVYAIAHEGEIDVLTVLHTRRRYPPFAKLSSVPAPATALRGRSNVSALSSNWISLIDSFGLEFIPTIRII